LSATVEIEVEIAERGPNTNKGKKTSDNQEEKARKFKYFLSFVLYDFFHNFIKTL
jgi:hypothetical protein